MQHFAGTALIDFTQSDLDILNNWLKSCMAYQVTATSATTMTLWFLARNPIPSGVAIVDHFDAADPTKITIFPDDIAASKIVYSGSTHGKGH